MMVFRFDTDKKSSHTGVLEIIDRLSAEVKGKDQSLLASGDLVGFKYPDSHRHNKPTNKIALDYTTQVKVPHEGEKAQFHKGKSRSRCAIISL